MELEVSIVIFVLLLLVHIVIAASRLNARDKSILQMEQFSAEIDLILHMVSKPEKQTWDFLQRQSQYCLQAKS